MISTGQNKSSQVADGQRPKFVCYRMTESGKVELKCWQILCFN